MSELGDNRPARRLWSDLSGSQKHAVQQAQAHYGTSRADVLAAIRAGVLQWRRCGETWILEMEMDGHDG